VTVRPAKSVLPNCGSAIEMTQFPRKDAMLPEVMLRPPRVCVVGIAVDWLPGNGQQGHGWAPGSSWCRDERGMLAGRAGLARLDYAGLVGQDDGLDPVAQAELGEQISHV
jgi:hypothetical protein